MNKELKVAEVFSNYMVIQRNAEIPVWGTACDNVEITAEFRGQLQKVKVIKGKWSLTFAPCSAGGPFEMKITDGSKEIVFNDILVGDVWVAGGQSNMDYVLVNTQEGIDEIPNANFKKIRYYDVPKITYDDEIAPCNIWQQCNSENAGNFSAVAYNFAKELHKKQRVPIGIINCSWGGTSAACWVSEDKLREDKDLQIYLDEFNEIVKNQDKEAYEKEIVNYKKKVDKYLKKKAETPFTPDDVDAYFADKSAGDYPWPPPMGEKAHGRPTGLYNTMLRKITPFAIKGVIWYQGENDIDKPNIYQKLFTKTIENWREDWNDQLLPFLFVQLSAYGNNNPQGLEYALLREQQFKVSQSVPNTGMAVSFDYGDEFNIHPTRKKAVGKRLALLARSMVYGQPVACQGPIFRDFEIVEDKIVLSFDNAEGGLIANKGRLKGFYIAGEDLEFVKANATMEGETVKVSCGNISKPKAVRYCFSNYDEGNLYNSKGLPACPFRTDC